MPDAAKQRRWTRLETVAWIAFRHHRAVRKAAKIATQPVYEIELADAMRQLEIAERAGKLVPDCCGRFAATEVQTLFPAVPDAGKWRRWTRLLAVAWIAFRDHAAVNIAAKIEARAEDDRPADLYMYLAIEGALHTVQMKGDKSNGAGAAVAKAMKQLEAVELAHGLAPDNSGRFNVDKIKTLFPSKEGRGHGQMPRDRMPDQKVVPLMMFFLTTRKRNIAQHNWDALFKWCQKRDLAGSEEQYRKLRAEALKRASTELALRHQHNVGVIDSKRPLTAEEYVQCKENLASWQRQRAFKIAVTS